MRPALKLRLFLACALAVLTAGCELLPLREGPVVERPARERIAAFSFDGRVAVRQGDTRNSANIEWRHQPGSDEILLTTPLGQGVAELRRDARGARLVTADKEAVEAPDWEELSARVFGIALPLANMPRWLLGDVPYTRRDSQGRPQEALASGWDIRYLDYESPAPSALPVLIELRRDDIELRLKVDAWQLE